MNTKQSLIFNLAWVLFVLFALQAVLVLSFLPASFRSTSHFRVYLLTSFLFHIAVFILSYRWRSYFILSHNKQALRRVNVPIWLTFTRLSSTPALSYFVYLQSRENFLGAVLIYMIPVFVTDFFDGLIARKFKQVTEIGKLIDSASDYVLLFAMTIAFMFAEVLHLWFVILVAVRFFSQTIAMFYLHILTGEPKPIFSFWGKASVFGLMVYFAFLMAKLLGLDFAQIGWLDIFFEYGAALIIFISIYDKAVIFLEAINDIHKNVL